MKTYLFFAILVFALFSCKSQTAPPLSTKFHTTVGGVEYTLSIQGSFLRVETKDTMWLTSLKKTSVMEIFDSEEKLLGRLWRYEGEEGLIYFCPEMGFMLVEGILPSLPPNYKEYFVANSFLPKSEVRVGDILCSDFGRNKTQLDWIANGGIEILLIEEGFYVGSRDSSKKGQGDKVLFQTKKEGIFLVFEYELDESPYGLIEINPVPLFTHKGHKYKKYKYLWSSF